MPGISVSKICIPFSGGGGVNWAQYWATRHPELATYISGLITPLSVDQIRRLGEFLEALKTGLSITNLDDAFDVMYVLGGETSESSLRNLVSSSYYATAVNSPTFTQYEGFASNGTTSYINTNFKATNGINLTQNSMSAGVYSRTNSDNIKSTFGAAATGGSANGIILTLRSSDSAYWRSNVAVSEGTVNTNSAGLFIVNRTASNAASLFRNKSSLENVTTTTVGLNNTNIVILAFSIDGAVQAYDQRQLSLFFAGKGLSTGNRDTIVDAFEAYMDANGKGVII